jgi:hypothetical protein
VIATSPHSSLNRNICTANPPRQSPRRHLNPQWFTRSSYGAGSVSPTTSHVHPGPRSPSDGLYQALLRDYGSSALRCARSSTRSPSGSTPSTPASVAASATGSPVLSNANSDSLPTDETHYWRSEHGGRSVRKLPETCKCAGTLEQGQAYEGQRKQMVVLWRTCVACTKASKPETPSSTNLSVG